MQTFVNEFRVATKMKCIP